MRKILTSVLLFASACAHAPAKPAAEPKAAAEGGAGIAELFKRETAELLPLKLRSPDGLLELTVEGRGQPSLKKLEDGSYLLRVSIGSKEEVSCVVGGGPDLASGSLMQRQGVEKFPDREVTEIDAGELGGAAFLSTRTVYVFEQNGQKVVGEAKTLSAHRGLELGAACVHDEVGYAQTLRRVVKSIMESMRFTQNPKPEPLYRDIAVVTLRGRRIGVIESSLIRLDNGKLWNIEASSMAIPTSPKDIQAEDDYESEISDEQDVETGTYIAMRPGEKVYEITLQRDPAGYHAEGTFQGKKLDTKIASKAALPSSLRACALMRELIAGKRREIVRAGYSPGSDPLGFTDHRTTASGDRDLPFRSEEHGVTSLSAYDEIGLPLKARINVGPITLDAARVAQFGKWPDAK
jgi:hypothetical protein